MDDSGVEHEGRAQTRGGVTLVEANDAWHGSTFEVRKLRPMTFESGLRRGNTLLCRGMKGKGVKGIGEADGYCDDDERGLEDVERRLGWGWGGNEESEGGVRLPVVVSVSCRACRGRAGEQANERQPMGYTAGEDGLNRVRVGVGG